MATLVFDIATVGKSWEDLDNYSRHSLTRHVDAAEAEDRLGLSPLTGEIAALGIYDVERKQGMVYLTGGEASVPEYKKRSEKELLEDFWEGAASYDVFVTFGGRRFDIPWLLHRSAILGVVPTTTFPRVRHLEKQRLPYHVDLHDEFTRYTDVRTPVTLHLLAEAYGLTSPDTTVLNGSTLAAFFQEKKCGEVAAYTERCVATTHELYERWLTHFAPPSFLNSLL